MDLALRGIGLPIDLTCGCKCKSFSCQFEETYAPFGPLSAISVQKYCYLVSNLNGPPWVSNLVTPQTKTAAGMHHFHNPLFLRLPSSRMDHLKVVLPERRKRINTGAPERQKMRRILRCWRRAARNRTSMDGSRLAWRHSLR